MNQIIICLTMVVSLIVVGYLIYYKVTNATIDHPIIKKQSHFFTTNAVIIQYSVICPTQAGTSSSKSCLFSCLT